MGQMRILMEKRGFRPHFCWLLRLLLRQFPVFSCLPVGNCLSNSPILSICVLGGWCFMCWPTEPTHETVGIQSQHRRR